MFSAGFVLDDEQMKDIEIQNSLRASQRAQELRDKYKYNKVSKPITDTPPKRGISTTISLSPVKNSLDTDAVRNLSPLSYYEWYMLEHIFTVISPEHSKLISLDPYIRQAGTSLMMANNLLTQIGNNANFPYELGSAIEK